MAKAAAKKAAPKAEEKSERAEIEVLDAEYGKGKSYKYKIEGSDPTYTYVEAGASKCRIDGVWYIAVFYRGEDGMLRSTTAERWRMRFTRVRS